MSSHSLEKTTREPHLKVRFLVKFILVFAKRWRCILYRKKMWVPVTNNNCLCIYIYTVQYIHTSILSGGGVFNFGPSFPKRKFRAPHAEISWWNVLRWSRRLFHTSEESGWDRFYRSQKTPHWGLFPERRFVAGFFRRLLAYLTPHISHTYPAHHTYPTHIHSKRIHHTYPTHIQHIAHIPHISIPNVSHPYVSHQYVSMQCVSIQKVVIRIPPITTHIPYISSTSYISHTYPFQTYPFQTYPTNTYPLQTYPFKRCASAGGANVSHQYISHQYVSSTRIPPVRIHSMRIHSKSLHQQAWQWVWVSLQIISYHCYSAGMVMNIKTLLFLNSLQNY